MISTGLLLVFLAIMVYTDIRWHKIHNWIVYPGILTGLLASFLDPQGVGFEESLRGFAGTSLIMICCFILFSEFGGGDVKLMVMISSFLGWQEGLECLLWSFVIGAAVGVSLLVWQNGIVRICRRIVEQISWLCSTWTWKPLTPEDRKALSPRLCLAPAAMLAVLQVKFRILG